jgi:hypothetical protein
MIHMQSPAIGQYRLNIINVGYDTSMPDTRLVQCVDTMPGHLFHAKAYNFLYKDDTNHLAVTLNEGTYLFHRRYTMTVFWKNGNKMHCALFNKHLEKYWHFDFYANDAPKECGKYKHGKRKGRWVYFNTMGLKVKVEHYAHDGTLKRTKTFKMPKNCWKSTFNPRHPGGMPYIITQ